MSMRPRGAISCTLGAVYRREPKEGGAEAEATGGGTGGEACRC